MGNNQNLWSRHLGKMVRDRNICHIQVKSWKKFEKTEKDHMWAVVKVLLLIQTL